MSLGQGLGSRGPAGRPKSQPGGERAGREGRQLLEGPGMLIHTSQWLWPCSSEVASARQMRKLRGGAGLALEGVLGNGAGEGLLWGGRQGP